MSLNFSSTKVFSRDYLVTLCTVKHNFFNEKGTISGLMGPYNNSYLIDVVLILIFYVTKCLLSTAKKHFISEEKVVVKIKMKL